MPKFSSMQIFKIFLRAISCFYINYRKLFVFLRCFSNMYACVHIHTSTKVCVRACVCTTTYKNVCFFTISCLTFSYNKLLLFNIFVDKQPRTTDRRTGGKTDANIQHGWHDWDQTPASKKEKFLFFSASVRNWKLCQMTFFLILKKAKITKFEFVFSHRSYEEMTCKGNELICCILLWCAWR